MVIITGNEQMLDKAVCISHSATIIGKGMNPIILTPIMDK